MGEVKKCTITVSVAWHTIFEFINTILMILRITYTIWTIKNICCMIIIVTIITIMLTLFTARHTYISYRVPDLFSELFGNQPKGGPSWVPLGRGQLFGPPTLANRLANPPTRLLPLRNVWAALPELVHNHLATSGSQISRVASHDGLFYVFTSPALFYAAFLGTFGAFLGAFGASQPYSAPSAPRCLVLPFATRLRRPDF